MTIPAQGYQVVVFNYKETGPGADFDVTKQLMITDARSYTAMGVAALPILSRCFLFQESIFEDGTIFGKPDSGIGDIEIDNTEGLLDSYRFFGFDGQQFKVYQIHDEEELLNDNTNLIFTGTLDYPEFQLKAVVFHCKNRFQEWSVPVQSKVFSGGLPDDLYSVLGPPIEYLSDPNDPEATPPDFQVIYPPVYDGFYPTRLEGEEDLAGKKKPMIFGRVLNAPGILVNSSKNIYAFSYDADGNRRALQKINRVCDKGTDILIQADFIDSATLMSFIPDPGYCATCLAEGLIRFGTIPQGDVTADIDESTISESSAPKVIARLLTVVLGYQPGIDFNQGDLDALHAINPAVVGVYLTGDEAIQDVVVLLTTSIGAWGCPDTRGLFRFGRIDLPSLYDSVATFTNDNILEDSLNRVQFGDENRGIPPQQVTIRHSKAWAVLGKGQTLESVDAYIRTFMANEYRESFANDPDILKVHPSAPTMIFDTLLVKGQRALIRNWDFQIELGSVTSPKQDWAVTNSAEINDDNQIVLTPLSKAQSSVSQSLTNPGQFSGGVWKIGMTSLATNASFDVVVGFTTIATVDMPAPGDYSVTLIIPETVGSLLIIIRNTVGSLTNPDSGIVDNVYMLELLPGLTPSQEAARRMTIMKSNFERFQFDVSVEDSKKARIGDVITLQLDDRFEMQDGVPFRVVGKTYDTDANEVEFDVVGGAVQQAVV